MRGSFKRNTTIPFLCMIFYLCKHFTLQIWHSNIFIEVTKIVDVGILYDEISLASPGWSTVVIVPPLGDELV